MANDAHLVAFLRALRNDVPTEFHGQALTGGTGAPPRLSLGAPTTPAVVERLTHLERLGLLSEETLYAIIGNAPIDEHRVLRALQAFIPNWTFQPLDCSVIAVLAKERGMPIALMQVDLLTDDVMLVARKGGQLVKHAVLSIDEILAVLRRPGITSDAVWAWFKQHIASAIEAGRVG